jgi:hypothetical protein
MGDTLVSISHRLRREKGQLCDQVVPHSLLSKNAGSIMGRPFKLPLRWHNQVAVATFITIKLWPQYRRFHYNQVFVELLY